VQRTVQGKRPPAGTSSANQTALQPPKAPAAAITGPCNGQLVPRQITVTGRLIGSLPPDRHLWLAVSPHDAPGWWWPQEGEVKIPTDGIWRASARAE